VRLEYSLDGGATWQKIAARVSDTSYRWMVPDTVSERCLFRVAQVYAEKGTTINLKYLALGTTFGGAHYNGDGSRIVAAAINTAQEGGAAIYSNESPTPDVFIKSGQMTDAVLSPDEKFIATYFNFPGGRDSIRVWDSKTGAKLWRAACPFSLSMSFSPDGQFLAAASTDWTIKIWQSRTGDSARVLQGTNKMAALAFSPDGSTIAGGTTDSTITIWDVSSGQIRQSFRTSRSPVSLAYSNNGKWIAVGEVRNAEIFDVTTEQLLHTLPTTALQIYSVAFSPDDSRLLTTESSGGKGLLMWDVSTGELIDSISSYSSKDGYSFGSFNPQGTKAIATFRARVLICGLLPTDPSDAEWAIERAAPISVLSDTIDFKQVPLGAKKDTVDVVALRNDGTASFSVTGLRLTGPDADMFAITDEVFTFTLAPGEVRRENLRFRPGVARVAHAELAFDYTGAGSPATVQLLGEGIGSGTVPQASAQGGQMHLTVVPNPVEATATLRFQLGSAAMVRISVSDATGKEVLTMGERTFEAGWQKIELDLGGLAGGEYYCVVKIADEVVAQQIQVVH
jgi:hypothetical protein